MLCSCKKNKDNTTDIYKIDSFTAPLGTITVDIQGVPTRFNGNAIADTFGDYLGGDRRGVELEITGFQNDPDKPRYSLRIWMEKTPATQFYPDNYPFLKNDSQVTTELAYDTTNIPSIISFKSADNPIKIFSIDSTVEGIFSGTLVVLDGVASPNTRTFTNGRFYVPIR